VISLFSASLPWRFSLPHASFLHTWYIRKTGKLHLAENKGMWRVQALKSYFELRREYGKPEIWWMLVKCISDSEPICLQRASLLRMTRKINKIQAKNHLSPQVASSSNDLILNLETNVITVWYYVSVTWWWRNPGRNHTLLPQLREQTHDGTVEVLCTIQISTFHTSISCDNDGDNYRPAAGISLRDRFLITLFIIAALACSSTRVVCLLLLLLLL
jgi:hypothetical protein